MSFTKEQVQEYKEQLEKAIWTTDTDNNCLYEAKEHGNRINPVKLVENSYPSFERVSDGFGSATLFLQHDLADKHILIVTNDPRIVGIEVYAGREESSDNAHGDFSELVEACKSKFDAIQ